MLLKKFFLLKRKNVRLFLYILSAVLTSLLADLKNYANPPKAVSSLLDLTALNLTNIFVNLLLHGVIAWRAYIDTTCKEEPSRPLEESEENCCDENKGVSS